MSRQTSVDVLWDMIPKDTQNYIVKQFDGYNKAKTFHKEDIIEFYKHGMRDVIVHTPIHQADKVYKEIYESDL
jgi:hypothetical protein